MSIKTTVKLTREQAIDRIVLKKCIEFKEVIKCTLNNFKNRDLEYLLDNVITSNDTITENIERIQMYASELPKFAPVISAYSVYNYTLKGVWDNALRSFIFNNYMGTRNRNIDINGFVDKDVEKYVTRGRVV